MAAGVRVRAERTRGAVVDLVVRGASTREISGALHISEYTVQERLSNAFDKVGVRGRRALVKRLFFDNLSPVAGVIGVRRHGVGRDYGTTTPSRAEPRTSSCCVPVFRSLIWAQV